MLSKDHDKTRKSMALSRSSRTNVLHFLYFLPSCELREFVGGAPEPFLGFSVRFC